MKQGADGPTEPDPSTRHPIHPWGEVPQLVSSPFLRCSLRAGITPRPPQRHCLYKIRNFWHLQFACDFQPKLPGCCLTPRTHRVCQCASRVLGPDGEVKPPQFLCSFANGACWDSKAKDDCAEVRLLFSCLGWKAPQSMRGPVEANGVRRRWLRFRRAEWCFNYYCYFKVKLWLLGASQFYRAHFIFPTFIWIICPLLAIKNAIYPIITSSSLYKHSIVLMSSDMNLFVYGISPEFVIFMV